MSRFSPPSVEPRHPSRRMAKSAPGVLYLLPVDDTLELGHVHPPDGGAVLVADEAVLLHEFGGVVGVCRDVEVGDEPLALVQVLHQPLALGDEGALALGLLPGAGLPPDGPAPRR